VGEGGRVKKKGKTVKGEKRSRIRKKTLSKYGGGGVTTGITGGGKGEKGGNW